jgi:hypothetical protein
MMNKRSKFLNKSSILCAVSVTALMVLFQNCSRVNLEKVEEGVSVFLSSMNPLAVCSESSIDQSAPKYIFLVDMSASNLGKSKLVNVTNHPIYGNTQLNQWDSSQATDANGDRLTMIKNFLTPNGVSTDNNVDVAIIPFSWDRKFSDAATMSVAWKDSTKGFVSKTTAASKVDALLKIQNGFQDPDSGVYTPGAKDFYNCLDPAMASFSGNIVPPGTPVYYYQDEPTSDCPDRGYALPSCTPAPGSGTPLKSCDYHMGETSYLRALEATNRMINEDIAANQKNPDATKNYYVFLISDGAPQDSPVNSPYDPGRCMPKATDPNYEMNCQEQKIFAQISLMETSMKAAGRKLYLYGLYYGGEPAGEAFMNKLVSYAKNGRAKSIANFGGGAANGDFFKSVIESMTVFEPSNIQMIPLTTILKNGVVYADSDMDGVIDIEEASIDGDLATPGLQPLSADNPRSNSLGLLDGLYVMLVKNGQLSSLHCLPGENNFSTNELDPGQTPTNYTGLTKCDMRALGILIDSLNTSSNPTFGLDLDGDGLTDSTFGLDTDDDGLIDLVEILKFLNPADDELSEDTDRDSMTTVQEILRGSDPLTPDSNLPANLINRYTVTPVLSSAGMCSSQGTKAFTVKIDSLQTTSTLDISQSSNVPSYLKHGLNEGVVYIGYRLVQSSSTEVNTLPKTYKGQFVRVKYLPNGQFEVLDEDRPFVTLGTK